MALVASEAPFDGQWWAPDDPAHRVAGRLSSEDGIWNLTLHGWLGDWASRPATAELPHVLHGRVGGVAVTLQDVVTFAVHGSGDDGPNATEAAANLVLEGAHVVGELVCLDVFVRVAHLTRWAARSPWGRGDERPESPGRYTITCELPPDLRAAIPGATVALSRTWAGSFGAATHSMTSHEMVRFELDEPTSLDAVRHDLVRPLVNLLELATSRRCEILELSVRRSGAGPYEPPVSVVSPGTLEARDSRDVPHQVMLFSLASVSFEDVIPRWWELHRDRGLVCDLLSSLDGPGYVGMQFLAAASAVEAYHHRAFVQPGVSAEHRAQLDRIFSSLSADDVGWLKPKLAFSHQPSFAERLHEVIDRAGPTFAAAIGDPREWVRWVKKGRNSIAHRAPGMSDIETDWEVTVRITPTIRWLLTIVLLNDLGIPSELVDRGMRQIGRLGDASDALRTVKPEWFSSFC